MSQVSELLSEIERYCAERGLKESTFGLMAVNDGKFVQRLRDGGGVTVKTLERVRDFIAAQPRPQGAPSAAE